MRHLKRYLAVPVLVAVLLLATVGVAAAADPIPGDITGDGHVNVLDLILVGQSWQLTGPPGWVAADINHDGWVNILDMIVVCQNWTG